MTITTTDFDNALLDLAFISEIANVDYTASTATNRNSDVVDTVIGRLAKLGYIPAVTYAGSISFTTNDNTKTVDRSGIIYAPLYSALPFTTSNWATDEAKFFIVQDTAVTTALLADVADLTTLTGVASNQVTMGSFTGTTITSNQDIKECLQELETAHEVTVRDNWVLVSTQEPTAIPQIDITLVPATYKAYRIELSRVRPSSGTTSALWAQIDSVSGSGSYKGVSIQDNSANEGAFSVIPISYTATMAVGDRLNSTIEINHLEALVPTQLDCITSYTTASNAEFRQVKNNLIVNNSAQTTLLSLYWSSGLNFNASGTIMVYGLTA